jgi:long-chain fatty acid transport protein
VRENGAEFTGSTPLTGGATRSETQKSLNFYIPNAYYTRTTDSGNVAYGVGIFSPFGLGQEYNDKNTSIFRNQITKIDLQTVVVNPTVAFKVGDALSVGAGIDYMWGRAKLEQTPVASVGNLYNFSLKGDGDAWGYNFGLLLKPSANLRIGANYRSPFNLTIKNGDATISSLNPVYGTGALGQVPSSTQGSTTVAMPATFALGAAYTIGQLTVEADADWTFWHSFTNLPITFQRNAIPTLPNVVNDRQWKDVCAVRVGAEYRVTDPLALRVGFVYDPSPAPAGTLGPDLPDADRLNYMVGAGYKIGAWTIDGAFMYIDKKDRTVSNFRAEGLNPLGENGKWTGNAWLAGLDVGYKF